MKVSSQQIAAFTEVFRQRSVSDAASVLGITQSAVTQHLAKLEQRVGSTLFIRYRTGLEPTKAAQELFLLTDRIDVLEKLVAEKVNAYSSLFDGNLSIIANAPRPAMPLIARFKQNHPGVKVTFALLSWTKTMERLAARDVDIAIITEPDEIPGMFQQELTRNPFVAMLRCEHPLAAQQSVTMAELANEVMILPEDGSLTQRELTRASLASGIRFANAIQMTTYAVMKEAVLHGLGVGIFLEDSVFPSREFVFRPVRELEKTFGTYVVTTKDKTDLKLVRAFLDECDDSVRAMVPDLQK
ncbi:LysR family transcriptional regulator [Rhizobium puerariae]|uniref:LysR family transcriptional regulator n=1 Tax=Rhizobium puerariae TaxID=1585791 RepID=A0ABV6AAF7_9HYPH